MNVVTHLVKALRGSAIFNPDANGGVRMNIRLFLSVSDIGKREAVILREKPYINWDKDCSRDVLSTFWDELCRQYGGKEGDCINGHYFALVEKRIAWEKNL